METMDLMYLDVAKTGNKDGRYYNININYDKVYNVIKNQNVLVGFNVEYKSSNYHFSQIKLDDYVVLNEESYMKDIIHNLQVKSINTKTNIIYLEKCNPPL